MRASTLSPTSSFPRHLRSTRRRMSTEAATAFSTALPSAAINQADETMPGASPDHVVAVLEEGDVVLQISGLAGLKKLVGVRCSSLILAMTSPVFKTLLASASDHESYLSLPDDDGDALLLMCNILHLRNDALPSRLPADLLYRLASLVHKYQCSNAAGRATIGWFDRLLRQPHASTNNDVSKIIQAAYLLNEPASFVRFTERWVLYATMNTKMSLGDSTSKNDLAIKLAAELYDRQQFLIAALRADIDLIVDPCSLALSQSSEHYIDYMPGMTPDKDEETGRVPSSLCYVDRQCSTLFLGALRDDLLWPTTVWQNTLGSVMESLQAFEIPDYDDCDKCEFCEDVKTKFEVAVELVKSIHRERLWGLCLDCFQAGGVFVGECRCEHPKPAQHSA